jgi:hypothetical protein
MMGRRRLWLLVVSSVTVLVLAAGVPAQALARSPRVGSGHAGHLTVGQRSATCPDARYGSIQAAIDAARPGDTVTVCPGSYVEGSGARGSSALTIAKSINLTGAGADQVTIEPRNDPASGGQIAEDSPDIRDGRGDVVAVVGSVAAPITVNITGVTVDAHGVYATAGVVFVDAGGSLDRSRVTGVDTSEAADAYTKPGGFRSNPFGYGVAQVTRATPASAPSGARAVRTLTIDHTRVDHYNAIGVLVDGATGDYSPYTLPGTPLVPSGIENRAVLTDDQIAGRNLCQNYNDPTAGGPAVIDGDCQASGGSTPIPPPLPLTTGPLFGQDGVRVTAGASVQMTGDTVSSNLVNGTGSPVQTVLAPTPNNDPYPLGNYATNNQNLRLGAGVRLVGAAASTIASSNITDNAFGVLNTTLERLVGPAHRRRDAAGPWPRGLAGHRHAVGFHLQPAGTGEPGQRRRCRRRELPGRRLRFGRRCVLPLP